MPRPSTRGTKKEGKPRIAARRRLRNEEERKHHPGRIAELRGYAKETVRLQEETGQLSQKACTRSQAGQKLAALACWRDFWKERGIGDKDAAAWAVNDIWIWAEELAQDAVASTTKIYVWNIIDILMDQGRIKNEACLEYKLNKVVNRISTWAKAQRVEKADPITWAKITLLAGDDRRKAQGWLDSGCRRSSYETWCESSITRDLERAGVCRVVCRAKHEGRARWYTCTSTSRNFFKGDYASPPSRAFTDRILNTMGATGHSCRRAWALHARWVMWKLLKCANMTECEKADPTLFARVRAKLGWEESSQQLSEYTSDWLCHKPGSFPVSKAAHLAVFRTELGWFPPPPGAQTSY